MKRKIKKKRKKTSKRKKTPTKRKGTLLSSALKDIQAKISILRKTKSQCLKITL